MPKKAVAPHSERESKVIAIRVNRVAAERFDALCNKYDVKGTTLLQHLIERQGPMERLLKQITNPE